MKLRIADGFGLFKKYPGVYLFSAGIFILGLVLGLFLWRNWNGSLMWIVLNEAFSGGKAFPKVLWDTLSLIFILQVFGFTLVLSPAMLVFQGMVFGVSIAVLTTTLGAGAAAAYLLPWAILLAPVMIAVCGNGILTGLRVIRMIRDETINGLLGKSALLFLVLFLPAALLYSGIKTLVTAPYIESRISELTPKLSLKELDRVLFGFIPADDPGNPSDFALFRISIWQGASFPSMLIYKSAEDKTVRVCLSGDTNLLAGLMPLPPGTTNKPHSSILYLPARGILIEWLDPALYFGHLEAFTNSPSIAGIRALVPKE
ncbi:MAG: hypothetical protein A2Y33_14885 [Spirochaetes bacterium GWF1_51_8]|nr:MAG: hypothetical protein A2Y33_14885 [Spirochaetes bacterium GWF1_51_8]